MKPILFNTEMVAAILDDRKTATRRKLPREILSIIPFDEKEGTFNVLTSDEEWSGPVTKEEIIEKYAPCKVADTLYVRETWTVFQSYSSSFGFDVLYAADECVKPCMFKDMDRYLNKFSKYEDRKGWNSPYSMPKEAARIFLRVTDVRFEKLQDITDEQAEKEGCFDYSSTANGFCYVWESTIKKAEIDRYGWGSNPYIFVIEFEKCDKPEDEEANAL